MVELILDILQQLGWVGLIFGVAIEALSIPFPAALFVLTYGYLLDPSWGEVFLFSIFTTVTYVIVSFVPLLISVKYEHVIKKKLPQSKVEFAHRKIEKYGDWMIALGRFVGMGYISYIAGFCKIKPFKFAVLTFVGFYPISVMMFYLGSLGNVEEMANWLQNTQGIIMGALILLGSSYIFFRFRRKKKYHHRNIRNREYQS
ncbi:hypothetical protein LGQ02_16405 [Bacillus shivajii]|uniref:DedA family protein n=1 Tax=Bacillus shivajii TaxID=1983719 RepID=UPI001CF94977|nr:hypothetical protein [Bacillus shivajii]UCZ52406.1 hypothetical protein LGQ02_16405 [Bacillus shivajii]